MFRFSPRRLSPLSVFMSMLFLIMSGVARFRPRGGGSHQYCFPSSSSMLVAAFTTTTTTTTTTSTSTTAVNKNGNFLLLVDNNRQNHYLSSSLQRQRQRQQCFSSFFAPLFMSAVDEDEAAVDDEIANQKTIDSEWNIKGLKKEVDRLILRSHKKIGKSSTRVQKAREIVDKLTSDPDATLEQLEACPNLDALELELSELRTRLQGLNELNDLLAKKKGGGSIQLEPDTAQLALELGVDDKPPKQQPRGPKKKKGPRSNNLPKTRLPYRRFYTLDKTEIRVGKQAEDNDELSLNSQHRDGSDWWMHASGCPGSHVVIRCNDENVPNDVVQDAAALAARQSKCSGGTIKVSMTRCRDVKKPMGAKAGLVQLTGRVRTVSVNMKEAEKRLERLDKTVAIN